MKQTYCRVRCKIQFITEFSDQSDQNSLLLNIFFLNVHLFLVSKYNNRKDQSDSEKQSKIIDLILLLCMQSSFCLS